MGSSKFYLVYCDLESLLICLLVPLYVVCVYIGGGAIPCIYEMPSKLGFLCSFIGYLNVKGGIRIV